MSAKLVGQRENIEMQIESKLAPACSETDSFLSGLKFISLNSQGNYFPICRFSGYCFYKNRAGYCALRNDAEGNINNHRKNLSGRIYEKMLLSD